MSKNIKKTDWEIARGLADWIISLGLPTDGQHQKWANFGEVEYGYEGDHIVTYISGDYVSLTCVVDGEEVNELSIHSTSFGNSFGLSDKLQTVEELMQAVNKYAEDLNIRKWNKVYRNKLRFLVTEAEQRREAEKQARIEKLEAELEKAKNEQD